MARTQRKIEGLAFGPGLAIKRAWGGREIVLGEIDLPIPQDSGDDRHGKSCCHEPPHDPGGLFLVLRLLNPLASQVAPRQFLFVVFLVGGFDRARDQIAAMPLRPSSSSTRRRPKLSFSWRRRV